MRLILSFLLIFTMGHQGMASTNTVSKAEKKALVDLFESTNGTSWTTTWNMSQPIGSWKGVTVKEGHITAINLFNNNLNSQVRFSVLYKNQKQMY